VVPFRKDVPIATDRQELIEAILGYVNFSDGAPSPSFQAAVSDYYRLAASEPGEPAWRRLHEEVKSAAVVATRFGDLSQALRVADAVHTQVLPGYKRFHSDLLGHLADREDLLFHPYFVARCYEAVLIENRKASSTSDDLASAAVARLNDFVGHRPVAVLERRRVEPYPHERVRPIPLYLKGPGVGFSPYEPLIRQTLEILEGCNESVANTASWNLDCLDELALDPRAYDHLHPVNQRPGYQFGEWDPHVVDGQGRYRRFVLRLMILDALLEWARSQGARRRREALFEASATLAGTILLASAVSGWGPSAHSSDVSLATLMPVVAWCRDAFYADLLQRVPGAHGRKLREEAEAVQQPFGSVRTFLNHEVARGRAEQLVHDQLALLYARMGYVAASRAQSAKIDAPSTRMRTEIDCLIVEAGRSVDAGRLSEALDAIAKAEDVLHRAVECGALVDPWNILGFQGNFNRFQSIEDSIVDVRIDVLLRLMQDLFDAYSAALREAAATGDAAIARRADERFERLAEWWDQFASVEVSDVRRVCGRERLQAARFVAKSLADWRESGESAGNVSFWRSRADEFQSPQSFGLVVDALLDRKDFVSSMALMMQWLSVQDSTPLEDAGYSFYDSALRWMSAAVDAAAASPKAAKPSDVAPSQPPDRLIAKFFDFLEANAGSLWQAPGLFAETARPGHDLGRDSAADFEEDDLFAAAYEGVTFRGESEDGVDAPLAGGGPPDDDALLERFNEVSSRLRFLGAVARLWRLAACGSAKPLDDRLANAPVDDWIHSLVSWKRGLAALLEQIEAYEVQLAAPSSDSFSDFERRSSARETLAHRTIAVAIETSHALRALLAMRGGVLDAAARADLDVEDWEADVVLLERAVLRGEVEAAKRQLVRVRAALADAPLMYVPTDKGGRFRDVFAAQYARDVIRTVALQLPAIGDFEGTHALLETVLDLERDQSSRSGRVQQVSEFNTLFRVAFRSLTARLVAQLNAWDETRTDDLKATRLVGAVVAKFSSLWATHIESVRICELERRSSERQWRNTRRFIQTYGADLFTQAFMAVGNLRGILHQGAKNYIEKLIAEPRPPVGAKLVGHLRSGEISLDKAADHLDFIARCVLERHAVYRDYNTTTPQSDYGDNLHLLLELLRVLADFERRKWALEPGYIAHSELVRQGRFGAAELLRSAFVKETDPAARMLRERLSETEAACGLRLPTVAAEIAEGFTGQLRIDKMIALAEQAVAWSPAKAKRAFKSLCAEIDQCVAASLGSGVDLPDWLVSLEEAVERVLDARRGKAADLEQIALSRRPPVDLHYEDFCEEVERWSDE
jgi:hypothetical protein